MSGNGGIWISEHDCQDCEWHLGTTQPARASTLTVCIRFVVEVVTAGGLPYSIRAILGYSCMSVSIYWVLDVVGACVFGSLLLDSVAVLLLCFVWWVHSVGAILGRLEVFG